jgi:2-oxoglutarate ferredoxin oxidoreductase subunit delta
MSRTSERKGKIVISREQCKGCKYCVIACPRGVLALGETLNSLGYFPARVVNVEACTGCALCARMCPDICIEVWVED